MHKKYQNQIIRRITPIILLITLTLTFVGVTEAFAENPHFTSIDYPESAQSTATAVNRNGDIVGYYVNPGVSPVRGYLLHDGAFTPIVKPGASQTSPYGINDAGDISGMYVQGGVRYGFILPAGSSSFQTIQYPDYSTWVYGITNGGVLSGAYYRAGAPSTKAFTWHNGVFSDFEAPFPGTGATYAHAANDAGEIVGAFFYLTSNQGHGFLLLPDGTYVNNDFPDSIATINWGISRSSLVVGQYTDVSNVTHGFLMKNGEYSVFDFPESAYTVAYGIAETNPFDRKGMRNLSIVGGYRDSSGVGHGFLFTRQIGVGKGESK